MTKISGLKYQDEGGIYGVRTWVENRCENSKNKLGWADFRVTQYEKIKKWWELVMSAYLMICLQSTEFNLWATDVPENFQQHEQWNDRKG